MTLLRGRGIAAVNYPTGMNLGGDPTQALVHATTVGNFVITLSSVDLGQGLKTVLAQIGAEALGVPFDMVRVDTGDTDTGPHCMGTFASRATHRAGNAIVRAADEAKKVLLEVAAEEMEASPEDLETDGEGNVRVIGSPGASMSVMDVALAAHFKQGKTISGRGMYMKPKSELDPETGHVRVLRLASAYEIGCAINPALVQGQIRGGAWMGMSHALYETTAPYYPTVDHAPGDFNTYLMPGPLDLPEIDAVVLEVPSSNGPYGMKGVGEMTANPPIPAIVNAITDAIGVQITDLPVTPEKVLRALESREEEAA
jgi:CO/xanthine dehydrogenase Mo-binding subunit